MDDTIDGLIGPFDYYPDDDEDDLLENIHTNDPVANASERRRRRSESEHEREGRKRLINLLSASAIFYLF
jgi:hypothetical protein